MNSGLAALDQRQLASRLDVGDLQADAAAGALAAGLHAGLARPDHRDAVAEGVLRKPASMAPWNPLP